jgi:Ca-activated chloride channel homolog
MELAFENPAYLWLLFSLPLLVFTHFILLKHIKKKAMKFANFEAMKRVEGVTFATKNLQVLILRLFIILFLVLSVSGTTLWYEGMSNKDDFVLAIDASASMTAQDFEPNRLDAAKKVAIEFVDTLDSKTEVGIISFAGASFIEQLPTSNLLKVKDSIKNIKIMAAGGTDLSSAIITSTNMLLNSRKEKNIILLTDGSNTAGSFVENIIEKGAYYAKKYHVIIHTIGIGKNETLAGYVPLEFGIPAFFDETAMKTIANITGGKYYRASNIQELRDAYMEISENKEQGYLSINLSFTFLLIALVLVFVEWGLINTRFRALP